jgi:hypothetical protein
MRFAHVLAAGAGIALAVRIVRSRRRRSLHPAGRSFHGEFSDAGLLGHGPARYPATVRVSKAIGTRGGRPDVRGLAVRVHRAGRDLDLLFSTSGRGRITRHLPKPRRTFDALYGTLTGYRIGTGEKVLLIARAASAGRRLDEVAEGDRFEVAVRNDSGERPAGVVTLGRALSPAEDAALAFDPVRNSLPDLHPTGLVHGARAFAYRVSQRWRGARPAPDNPPAVARTAGPR